jgi:hypothetical protein
MTALRSLEQARVSVVRARDHRAPDIARRVFTLVRDLDAESRHGIDPFVMAVTASRPVIRQIATTGDAMRRADITTGA